MIEHIKAISIYLVIGTIGMIVLALLRAKKYEISYIKSIVSMCLLTLFGVLGVLILFYIENGYWGGQSFFGAVLITPILLFPVSVLMRINYLKYISFCAPAECFMLAVMKLFCIQSNCCYGNPKYPIFEVMPLQLIEAFAALGVMVGLILIEYKKNQLSTIYFWYFVLYGTTRLILNSYRAILGTFIFGLPAGHFWSIVSIFVGFIGLRVIKNE